MDLIFWVAVLLLSGTLCYIAGMVSGIKAAQGDPVIEQRLATYATRPPEPVYTVADIRFLAEVQRGLGEE